LNKKPPVSPTDKDAIANQIINLIRSINKMVHTKDVDTFDLRDIRNLVKKKADRFEIDEFHNCFVQIWKVWPDT
jgi:hypothetical protein